MTSASTIDALLEAEKAAQARYERETIVTGAGDSIADLRHAFDLVANRENWKLPVDATVKAADPAERRRIAEAVVFFTGSVVEWSHFGRGRWNCKASGYYAAIGA